MQFLQDASYDARIYAKCVKEDILLRDKVYVTPSGDVTELLKGFAGPS